MERLRRIFRGRKWEPWRIDTHYFVFLLLFLWITVAQHHICDIISLLRMFRGVFINGLETADSGESKRTSGSDVLCQFWQSLNKGLYFQGVYSSQESHYIRFMVLSYSGFSSYSWTLSKRGGDQSSLTRWCSVRNSIQLWVVWERGKEGGGRRNGWRYGSFSLDKKKQLCLPNCAFIPPFRSCIQQLSSSLPSSRSWLPVSYFPVFSALN